MRPAPERMYELARTATWRVGRKVGRTIYAQMASEPSDGDMLIGMMDTPALAQAVVQAHNRLLADLEGADGRRRL